MQAKDRILVALDVSSLATAQRLVAELAPYVGGFKVGLQLTTAEGAPQVVRAVRYTGGRVMLDLKLHDIPATMAGAVRAASSFEADFLTIHASAGPKGIAEAVAHRGGTKILGVTVLTSHDAAECRDIYGEDPSEKVFRFAEWLAEAGADGIVCSPRELTAVQSIRTNLSEIRAGRYHMPAASIDRAERISRAFTAFTKVIPGIRPDWASTGDQHRAMTPGEAVRAGANYLVIGRPILKPPAGMTPIEAAQRIAEEINTTPAATG